jgi:hypothetical protein
MYGKLNACKTQVLIVGILKRLKMSRFNGRTIEALKNKQPQLTGDAGLSLLSVMIASGV